jgi:hypothetical protein
MAAFRYLHGAFWADMLRNAHGAAPDETPGVPLRHGGEVGTLSTGGKPRRSAGAGMGQVRGGAG